MTDPKRYRKKPVVIEAMGPLTVDNSPVIAAWCGGTEAPRQEYGHNEYPGDIFVPTLEGPLRASVGDYLIRGVKGEFYPCKPDIFAATYDPVEESVEAAR